MKDSEPSAERLAENLAILVSLDPENAARYLLPVCELALSAIAAREQRSEAHFYEDFDPAAFETRLVPKAHPEAVNGHEYGGSNGVTTKALWQPEA